MEEIARARFDAWPTGSVAGDERIADRRAESSARSRATGPARCRDLAMQRLQRREMDLGERRERLDRVEQHVEGNACADRQRCLLEPLAGLRAERVGAGQP